MNLKLPKGEIRTTLELEELSTTQQYGISPLDWDELPVAERVRMMAAARDKAELAYLAALPEDKASNIRGTSEWVMLEQARP